MTRAELYEKYADALKQMYEQTGDDKFTCFEMIARAGMLKREGEEVKFYHLADFDYETFLADYEAMSDEMVLTR